MLLLCREVSHNSMRIMTKLQRSEVALREPVNCKNIKVIEETNNYQQQLVRGQRTQLLGRVFQPQSR